MSHQQQPHARLACARRVRTYVGRWHKPRRGGAQAAGDGILGWADVGRGGGMCGQVDAGWTAQAERPYDPPLTQLGRDQAAGFGAALAEAAAAGRGPPVDVVVTSPFLRCVQARPRFASHTLIWRRCCNACAVSPALCARGLL